MPSAAVEDYRVGSSAGRVSTYAGKRCDNEKMERPRFLLLLLLLLRLQHQLLHGFPQMLHPLPLSQTNGRDIELEPRCSQKQIPTRQCHLA